MITSLLLLSRFLIGIVARLRRDAYFRSLGILTSIVLLVGTLYTWLVGGWPFPDALMYAVTTMSMNTPYSGPLVSAAGLEMEYFHMGYTFLSVGVFIVFTLETGKTMLATFEEAKVRMAERKARKRTAPGA